MQVLLALWLSTVFSTHALANPQWRVFLEPSFMRPAVSESIPGAQRTRLTGGLWTGDALQGFTSREWADLHMDWVSFQKAAAVSAQADWKLIRTRHDRDKRKVIRFIELRSDEPLVASAVLGPELEQRFGGILGTPLLVAVPNRYQAFLFAKLAAPPPVQFTREILEAYRATAYPVSVELFEVLDGRWKAVGIFEAP